MSEPLLEQVDAVEQFDDERRAFCVDAEVALEADEFADAEGLPPLVRRPLRGRRPVPSKAVLARRTAGVFHWR
jgi:hypothetical protein